MPTLNLKPTHKPVKAYYESLDKFDKLGVTHESAVRSAFQSLLESCGKQFKWTLVPEYSITLRRNKRIAVDGALIDDFRLTHGIWEARIFTMTCQLKCSVSLRRVILATTSCSKHHDKRSFAG